MQRSSDIAGTGQHARAVDKAQQISRGTRFLG
jgi:hypothetical protein